MSVSHELRYFHPDGTAGELPAWSKFSLIYGVNGIGELIVTIPTKNLRSDYFKRWGICEVWREVNGIPRLEGDKIWRLQYIDDGYDARRKRTIELRFLDDNNFLDSRIVESFLGTNAGTELIAADDYMKTVVSEQLDSLRANSKLTVAANTTQAATVSRLLGYNNRNPGGHSRGDQGRRSCFLRLRENLHHHQRIPHVLRTPGGESGRK